jgi:hypothetical protein
VACKGGAVVFGQVGEQFLCLREVASIDFVRVAFVLRGFGVGIPVDGAPQGMESRRRILSSCGSDAPGLMSLRTSFSVSFMSSYSSLAPAIGVSARARFKTRLCRMSFVIRQYFHPSPGYQY